MVTLILPLAAEWSTSNARTKARDRVSRRSPCMWLPPAARSRYARGVSLVEPSNSPLTKEALRERFLRLSRHVAAIDPADWYGSYLEAQQHRFLSDLEIVTRAVRPPARVLDIGCSPPFTLVTLRSLGYEVTGIDVNPSSFANSQREFGFEAVSCNIEQERLPFADQSFDVVLMCEVFEHLRINPVNTMREVHRLVKRGGFLHLTTPNLLSLGGLNGLLIKQRGTFATTRDLYDELDHVNIYGFSGHVREYTRNEVEGFLRKVGFARVESQFRFGGLRPWTRPLYALAPFLRPNLAVQAVR